MGRGSPLRRSHLTMTDYFKANAPPPRCRDAGAHLRVFSSVSRKREGAERRMAHLATCSPCEGEPAALAIGPPRQPALHRGVLSVPGRSSEPDGCSRTLIRARYYARPSVRSVKPRLSAPWQLPLRAADGPPGTPATPGVRNPDIALVTAPGSTA